MSTKSFRISGECIGLIVTKCGDGLIQRISREPPTVPSVGKQLGFRGALSRAGMQGPSGEEQHSLKIRECGVVQKLFPLSPFAACPGFTVRT